ncbi:nucleotidyltransferase family protein [Vibrio sp. EA2]|uniref:nucleotidyltransferase family protein n=1 Tax=Vibrio sp. EA2 TaxID=3079860 RepID=UPI00294A0D42|nr:nucleotidyltransferase family protein [Vibrio sp. EA2]MDV6250550.1 nucleotidyltransferase family protein [Vibrio sp. EA2]
MKIAVMIMAAGQSKRFGGCKLLSQLDSGHSLLSHAVDIALGSKVGPVFVVTGRWHSEIEHAQHEGSLPSVPLLYNAKWSEGLGNSIAHGVRTLAADYDAILITLADQVALHGADLIQISELAQTERIVCSHYNGKRAVPALFPASCFEQLMQLQGEHGARHLLRGDVLPVCEIPLSNAAFDIDTPQRLAEWIAFNR